MNPEGTQLCAGSRRQEGKTKYGSKNKPLPILVDGYSWGNKHFITRKKRYICVCVHVHAHVCACACVCISVFLYDKRDFGFDGLNWGMNLVCLQETAHSWVLNLALNEDKLQLIHANVLHVGFLVLPSSSVLSLSLLVCEPLTSSPHTSGQQIPREHLKSQELCQTLGVSCEQGTFC